MSPSALQRGMGRRHHCGREQECVANKVLQNTGKTLPHANAGDLPSPYPGHHSFAEPRTHQKTRRLSIPFSGQTAQEEVAAVPVSSFISTSQFNMSIKCILIVSCNSGIRIDMQFSIFSSLFEDADKPLGHSIPAMPYRPFQVPPCRRLK